MRRTEFKLYQIAIEDFAPILDQHPGIPIFLDPRSHVPIRVKDLEQDGSDGSFTAKNRKAYVKRVFEPHQTDGSMRHLGMRKRLSKKVITRNEIFATILQCHWRLLDAGEQSSADILYNKFGIGYKMPRQIWRAGFSILRSHSLDQECRLTPSQRTHTLAIAENHHRWQQISIASSKGSRSIVTHALRPLPTYPFPPPRSSRLQPLPSAIFPPLRSGLKIPLTQEPTFSLNNPPTNGGNNSQIVGEDEVSLLSESVSTGRLFHKYTY